MRNKLISMTSAAKLCSYEKDYLSLLARRGQLKAKKIGRKWYTDVDCLNEYLENYRADEIIKPEKISKMKKVAIAAALALPVFAFVIFGGYRFFADKTRMPDNFNSQLKEIIRIPDENGEQQTYELREFYELKEFKVKKENEESKSNLISKKN